MLSATQRTWWSSAPSADAAASDALTLLLAAPVCVITAVQLRPLRARHLPGEPVFAPAAVRLHVPAEPSDSQGALGYSEGGLQRLAWAPAGPAAAVACSDALQTIELAPPALCVGGLLKVELIGRQTAQARGRWPPRPIDPIEPSAVDPIDPIEASVDPIEASAVVLSIL